MTDTKNASDGVHASVADLIPMCVLHPCSPTPRSACSTLTRAQCRGSHGGACSRKATSFSSPEML